MGVYAVTGRRRDGTQAAQTTGRRYTVIGLPTRGRGGCDFERPGSQRGRAVLVASDGRLDGAVLAAACPTPGDSPTRICEVHYSGVVDCWRHGARRSRGRQRKSCCRFEEFDDHRPAGPRRAVRALLAATMKGVRR